MATYNATSAVPFNVTFEGVAEGAKAVLTVLAAPDGWSVNALGSDGIVRNAVTKTETELVAGPEGVFGFKLANWEVAVLTT